jgi:IS605 OrfB family transposase
MHQKKRKLHKLKLKLEKVKNTQSSILFGSRKLWNKQFNLEANEYKNHQEWLTDWRNARISGFTLVGSSDETNGNQNCQLVGNTLKVRVPPALEYLYGKYYYLENITFPYGQEDINYALSRKQAITYKFSYKNDKWYLNCSITISEVHYQSNKNNGCLGLDINPNIIGWAYCDKEGNLKNKGQIKFNLRDKSTHQVKAIVGDVVKELVAIASSYKCPIAIEKLDFSSKKASMKESGIRYSRMLSNFAYSTITEMLDSRGSKYGIQIVKFNPAYSSFIGLCKYLKMYGLSSDTAAALVLARRMYRYSERVPAILASLVPVDTSKHVWSIWNKVKKELGHLKRHGFFSGVANSQAEVNLQDEVQARSSRKPEGTSAQRCKSSAQVDRSVRSAAQYIQLSLFEVV